MCQQDKQREKERKSEPRDDGQCSDLFLMVDYVVHDCVSRCGDVRIRHDEEWWKVQVIERIGGVEFMLID